MTLAAKMFKSYIQRHLSFSHYAIRNKNYPEIQKLDKQ